MMPSHLSLKSLCLSLAVGIFTCSAQAQSVSTGSAADSMRAVPSINASTGAAALRMERVERSKRNATEVERPSSGAALGSGGVSGQIRPERTQRLSKDDVSRSSSGALRAERSDRVERSDKGERGERAERHEHSHRNERVERNERSERGERVERNERAERVEKSERIERAERPEKAERTERGERPEKLERGERRS